MNIHGIKPYMPSFGLKVEDTKGYRQFIEQMKEEGLTDKKIQANEKWLKNLVGNKFLLSVKYVNPKKNPAVSYILKDSASGKKYDRQLNTVETGKILMDIEKNAYFFEIYTR